MYSLMYSLLKIAVSRILAKIISKSFCPCFGVNWNRCAKTKSIGGQKDTKSLLLPLRYFIFQTVFQMQSFKTYAVGILGNIKEKGD